MNLWSNDLLNREADAKLLTHYLAALHRDGLLKERSFVLNIDASWGQGKTYFMTNWAAQLRQENYRVAIIDAWATDYAEDPLIAVISELIKLTSTGGKTQKTARAFASASARIATSVVKHAGVAVINRALGEDGKTLIGSIGSDLATGAAKAAEDTFSAAAEAAGRNMIKRFEDGAATLGSFKNKLGDIVRAGETPLFIFIDELDRCRPSYAIAMLERIKHIFEVPGVVFVVATDTDQLSHSITAVYGSQFNGRGYLQRFFDRRYVFAEPDKTAFLRSEIERRSIRVSKWNSPPANDHLAFLAQLSTDFNLNLRDMMKVVDLLSTATTMWEHPVRLQLLYLAPLAIGFVRNHQMWEQLSRRSISRDIWQQWTSRPTSLLFKGQSEFGRTTYDLRIDVSELLSRMLQMSFSDLHNPSDQSTQQWLWDILDEERRLMYPEGYKRDQRSILDTYPEYIRTVSKLTTPDPAE